MVRFVVGKQMPGQLYLDQLAAIDLVAVLLNSVVPIRSLCCVDVGPVGLLNTKPSETGPGPSFSGQDYPSGLLRETPCLPRSLALCWVVFSSSSSYGPGLWKVLDV